MKDKLIAQHYESGKLLENILKGLEASGKDVHHLKVGDLAPVDEFHIRGRESTVEVANLAGFSAGERVLDVGCGLGGSARYLASEWGVVVSGIDLTTEFVEVGQQLNELVGMGDSVELQVASALELPFEDEVFDVVWTEHVQMNIEDKSRFYSELARVLRPGGRLVFHDIFMGEGGAVVFPVPWANDDSISFLIGVDEVRSLIETIGFECLARKDQSDESNKWFLRMLKNLDESGPRPFGLHLLLGEGARQKFGNIQLNLAEGRICAVQGVFKKI